MRIGVLALQGAVREHVLLLERAGAKALPVKYEHELVDLDGLVIPGGESTTIHKMMHEYQLLGVIKRFHQNQKPIFGTCAGLILISKEVDGAGPTHLGLLGASVKRNAFGRQKDSFEADIDIDGIGDAFPCVFIRAPYISHVDSGVSILAKIDDNIIAVRQGTILGAAFHPELTEDPRVHAYFVRMVKESIDMSGNK